MKKILFIYHPKSGDRVFVEHLGNCDEIVAVKYHNGCRHVYGGVLLEWSPTELFGGGNQRSVLDRLLREVIPQIGGISWDNRGYISAVIPRNWAIKVAQLVARVIPELPKEKSLVQLWHQGLAKSVFSDEGGLNLQYRYNSGTEEKLRLVRVNPPVQSNSSGQSWLEEEKKPGWDIISLPEENSSDYDVIARIRVPEDWGCGEVSNPSLIEGLEKEVKED